MSVTLPASRAVDDRRRRRLAVSGDATGADGAEADPAAGFTVLRERLAELPSASPWLPLGPWKRVFIQVGFWSLLGLLGLLIAQPYLFPYPAAIVLHPLTTGPSPKLAAYGNVVLWLLAAELAAIVGWYRSHSQLDFSGRYRIWGWVAFMLAGQSLLAGTQLHLILADAYAERLTWLTWRRETLAWLGPQALLGVLTFSLMDRDMRRCRSGLVLLRLSSVAGLFVAAAALLTPEMRCEAWYAPALLTGRLLALGLLVTGLWRQALYVAYVCPDPPDRAAVGTLLKIPRAICSLLIARWWVSAEVIEEPPPKRRRRKKTEEEGEESPAPKRRRRTTTTKAKRKPRTRPRPEPEEDEYETGEEDSGTDSWEQSEEDSDSGAADESTEGTEWNEDDLEQLEALTRPDASAQKGSARSNQRNSRSAQDDSDSEMDSTDGDDEGDYGGVDKEHGRSDMYKGLSKRQRRELKKQQRELERDGSSR